MSELMNNELINWAFPGGIGIVVLGAIGWVIKRIFDKKKSAHEIKPNNQYQIVNVTQSLNSDSDSDSDMENSKMTKKNKEEIPIEIRRSRTNILFIDDKKFDVVDILKNSGWQNTIWIKDVKSLNQKEILNANIIFVDIQGVGMHMRFSEEGLGLAKAIKEKYKESKKVVIYSAEQTGNRFHEALRIVDDSLDKDSDPYIFEDIVERLS